MSNQLIDIPIDATAMAALGCSRRFQLMCVYGVDSTSTFTRAGSAIHRFLELRGKGDTTPVTELAPLLANQFDVPARELLLPCLHFDSTQSLLVPATDKFGTPLVEYKFSIAGPVVNNKYRIIFCGTVDRVDIVDNTPIIRDFKATVVAKPAAKEKLVWKYLLSVQLPFYMYMFYKYLWQFMPDELAQKFASFQFLAQYWMIYRSFTPPKIELTSTVSFLEENVPMFEEMLNTAINKAIAIHERKTLCPPEGSQYFLCNECNFNSLCVIPNQERFLATLETLPRRVYDPTNFR